MLTDSSAFATLGDAHGEHSDTDANLMSMEPSSVFWKKVKIPHMVLLWIAPSQPNSRFMLGQNKKLLMTWK